MMNPGFEMLMMGIMFVMFITLMIFHGAMSIITG